MADESSIFTRYCGDFEGEGVGNHCPGAEVARQLFGQGWGMVAERLEERGKNGGSGGEQGVVVEGGGWEEVGGPAGGREAGV